MSVGEEEDVAYAELLCAVLVCCCRCCVFADAEEEVEGDEAQFAGGSDMGVGAVAGRVVNPVGNGDGDGELGASWGIGVLEGGQLAGYADVVTRCPRLE